ncbi:MAG TPA: zf-HC2 domain-containing protein [Pseudobacteroides sp.]|uniref:zf-HC2 domain-containing protein n=1 Tax=Pseudobacteroides sp. TaxID=1968840 RepID=UPI002F951AEB
MSCEKFSDLLMKFFDGNISTAEDGSLKEHIKSCVSCRTEFDSLNEIFNCYEEDNTVEPPEGFEASVMEKVNEYENQRRKRVDRYFMIIYGATFVVLGVISMFLLIYLRNGSILGASVKNEGLGEVFWGIVFFVYSLVKTISPILKDSINSYANYYLFAISLLVYLVIQKSIVEKRNREKTAQTPENN